MKVKIEFSITAQISSNPDKWMKFGISPDVEVKDMQDLKTKSDGCVAWTIREFTNAGLKVTQGVK